MNLFRVNRLPLFQAPDAPAGDAIDPAAPPVDPALSADPPSDPPNPDIQLDPPAPEPKIDGRKDPWFLKRIADESARARAAEQRASDAEALAARLQASGNPPVADPPRVPNLPPEDFNASVRAEAQRMRLSEDSTAVRDAGLKEFGAEFGQSLGILTAVGATSDDMVLDLIAVDKANAHKILASLAKDPEKAASLVGMDSRRRIAELTRMADAITAPTSSTPAPKPGATPPKQVSRAPNPAPPVDPSASKTVDWRTDDASDEEFDRGFKETMAKRSARR